MLTRLAIYGVWLSSFAAVNVMAKGLAGRLGTQAGFGGMAKAAFGSSGLYVIIILYGVCAVLYLASLRLMPLSVAGPLYTISGTVMTALLGVALFGEQMSAVKASGIGLCLIGVLLTMSQAPAIR